MAPRRRKFYPEFYTEEELAKMENAGKKNADENDITKEKDDDIESDITDTSQEEQKEQEDEEMEDNSEIISKLPESKSESTPKSPPLSSSPSPSPPPSSPLPLPSSGQTASTVRKSVPKSNNNGNGNSNNKTSASSGSSIKRKSPVKKVDLKDIDKAVPDDIKEKLYGSTGEKTDAVLKKLDAMQKDYVTQKHNVANAKVPQESIFEDNSDNGKAVDDIAVNPPEIMHEPEPEETTEYNDYPFDDEPYKTMDMMDVAATVMTGNTTPYNDSPYENENSENEIEDDIEELDDTVEVMEHKIEPVVTYKHEIHEEKNINMPNLIHEEQFASESENEYRLKYDIPQNIVPFNVENAIKYAHRWALDRNTDYLDFDDLGGDCTNYISQILLSGGCPMDKTPVLGWYYIDGNNKSPSWTGVEQLYKYLVKEKDFGIVAREIELQDVEAGDIVQLSFNGKTFQHSPFIVSVTRNADYSVSYDRIKICAHSFDSENRPLDTYQWRNIRFIRIFGYVIE